MLSAQAAGLATALLQDPREVIVKNRLSSGSCGCWDTRF